MYERFLADPDSVDAAWHDFFTDYTPGTTPGTPSDGARVAVSPVGGDGRRRTPVDLAPNGAAAEPAASAAEPAATEAATAEPASARQEAKPAPAQQAKPAPTKHEAPAEPAEPADPAEKTQPTEKTQPAGKAEPAEKTKPAPVPLRGAAARVVANMETSLTVPTATSVRAVPAKLLADNRIVINNHLRRARGGKVSFTHLIGYALVKALQAHPEMNNSFAEVDGRPTLVTPEHVNLGLAIDLQAKNGSRSLVVASLKAAETLDFARFLTAYEDIIRRARLGKLTTEDFAGTTISLTNPGTIGTVHSVPRLMAGQGTIIGVGAMEYPAAFAGMSEEALAQNAVSRTITLTSTYDHRIIQGAQSGEFLKRMHELLLGADGFYDAIFRSLRVPYEPVRWVQDQVFSHEGQIDKAARVIELINAYRTNGHLMADTDPLEFKIRSHPDLDIIKHGLTLWDLDREFPVGGFAGERVMKLRDILGVLRDAYVRRVGVEYMHITDPEERVWLQERIELKHELVDREEQKHVLGRLNAAEAFETFLQTKYVGQRRFSLEGAESVIPLLDAVLTRAAEQELDEVVIGMPHRGRLNVLANIVGKPYSQIFSEFEGNLNPSQAHGSG
ncbi:MAG: multifunctional oxoglutarate decarboxylase/oxoglutarate dehydrogenase thiamine pyrophosphate-binding subunit/dihydrolipoyllysine-residue succinyltransferase subunit, partial [Mycobacteriales bacterium]